MNKIIENIKKEKGVTLVALVVTIIVLLILAFIAISILMGDDGIIKKAEESKEETIKAQEREYIKLAYQDLEMEYRLNGTDITADRVMGKLQEYDSNIKVEMITKDEIGDTEIVVEKNSGEEYAEIVYTETEHKYAGSLVIDTNKARYEVTYNANRGSGGPTKQVKIEGTPLIITSEIPERKGYNFIGWARESTAVVAEYLSGSQYTEDANITLYAVWQLRTDIDPVAQIGSTKYPSIQEAIYDCSKEGGETSTTIILLKNTEEEFTTFEGQNIIIDLQGHTVTSEREGALCTNNGKLQIINGSLSSNKGTSILNNGEITIGDNSTGIDDNTPTIYGNKVGVDNKGTFNYYDGKIQGIVPIQGTTTSTPDQYGPVQTGYENGITTIQLRILTQYEARIGWVYYETLQGAIDIAKAKETVTLIKDLQLKDILQVGENKDVILDLYGYELTVASGLNTVIKNYGDLEITDNSDKQKGNISIISTKEGNLNGSKTYTSGIQNLNEGKLIINGGNIDCITDGKYNYAYGVYNDKSSTFSIIKGKISSNDSDKSSCYGIYNTSTSTVLIEGGLIDSTNSGIYNDNTGTVIVKGGEINCTNTGISNLGNGRIIMTGGTINSNGNNYSTYGISNKSDGIIVLENGIINSSNTGIYNTSTGIITIEGGSINSSTKGIYNYGSGLVTVTKGMINSNSDINTYGIHNKSDGTIKIADGTITSSSSGKSCYGIYNESDGKIIIGIKEEENISKEKLVIVGNYLGNSDSYSGYGVYNKSGQLHFFNGSIQGNTSLLGSMTEIKEGYKIEKNIINELENIYLVGKINTEYIAQVEKIKYYSLTDAIDSIEDKEEKIQLLRDFELEETVEFNKNIILDLNGHTITNNYYKITNMGNLTIMDSTKNQQGKIKCLNTVIGIKNEDNANIVLNGGEIYNNSETANNNIDTYVYGIYNVGSGTITIKEGIINSEANRGKNYGIYNVSNGSIKVIGGIINIINSNDFCYSYGIYNKSTGKVEITGGTISSSTKGGLQGFCYAYGIYNADSGNLMIEEGTVTGVSNGRNSNSYGIYNYETGKVEITGGSVNSNSIGSSSSSFGVYNYNSGTVKIEGGTVNSNSDNSGYGIYNRNSGTITLVNGEIINNSNHNGYGVYNNSTSGIVTIGIKEDGMVSQKSPLIKGITTSTSTDYVGYGIYNIAGKLYFYDGKIEGTTKAVYEIITEKEENSEFNYNEDETILTLTTEKLPIAQIEGITYTDLQEAINSVVRENTTIKILRNITYTKDNLVITIPNTKNIILDLNGYKIISAIPVKTIQNEGILTITDASEEKKGLITTSEETTIYNASGAVLTISEGTIENKNKYTINNVGSVILQGGIINSKQYGVYNVDNGTIILKGGTVNSDGGKNYNNCYAIYNAGIGEIIIEEGIICSDNYGKSSYGIYNKNTGTITIKGGTINSTLSGITSGTYSYGIYNESSGTITIKDGIVNSICKNSNLGHSYGVYNKNTGIVIIEKGVIISTSSYYGYGIYNVNSGTIIIGTKGNEIISQEELLIKVTKNSSSTRYVGYGIYNPKGQLYFYDGKIQGTDKAISGNITEIEDLTEINLSEETVDNKIYKTMILTQITTNVAKVNGTEYGSIQKAIEACGEMENTIELLRNPNIEATIVIGENQNITVDLKGYTINNYTELQNNGTLKIIDTKQTGKILSTATEIIISNTGTLVIQGGTISGSGYGVKNTGNVTLSGGIISDNTYGIYNNSKGTVNVESGTITSNTYGIYNYSSSSVTNINEGTITSNEYGIYNYNGTTNITTKGITSNTYGVYVANGTVTVKEGAEIQSETGIYVSNGALNIGETGTMNPDSPIIIGETYGLTVSGAGKVYMYDGQVKGKTGATEGYITYTEEGYVVANKTEGEYFVDYLALGGTANAVAQVNGVSYSNLQSAINSITGGEEQTIILLNGIVSTETYTIAEGQNIKLDMNGKTITSEAEETINNSGNLSIIDTSGKNVAKITSTTGTAIVNSGTLTLGEDEGTVTEGLITIEGEAVGIENTGESNFYDGAVIGETAINGEVKGLPSGYTITTSTVSGKQKATLTQ